MINEEMKQGIKKRKQLNREWRNTKFYRRAAIRGRLREIINE